MPELIAFRGWRCDPGRAALGEALCPPGDAALPQAAFVFPKAAARLVFERL